MGYQEAAAAINVLRDSHYALNPASGLFERTTLIEGSRTNLCLQSRDLTSASWLNTALTSRDAMGIDGTGATATTVTDNSAVAYMNKTQNFTIANDSNGHVVSIWIAKDLVTNRAPLLGLTIGGGGTIQGHRVSINTVTGAKATETASAAIYTSRVIDAGNWWIVEIRVDNNSTGNVTATLEIFPAARLSYNTPNDVSAQGSIVVGQVQFESNVAFGSSPIYTTTAAVTRAVDLLSYPFASPPQATTFYAKFLDFGTYLAAARVLQLGSTTAGEIILVSTGTGSGYAMYHYNAAAVVTASTGIVPIIGSQIELRGVLNVDGSVLLGQSINGAAETVSATSAPNGLPSAWSNQVLYIGQQFGGANVGFAGYQSVKVALGVKTLAEMRAA